MALRSMTGFGSAEGELSPRWRAAVKVSSVNSRFLEVVVRTQPRLDLSQWEVALRGAVADWVARGRVTVAIALAGEGNSSGAVSVNWGVAEALLSALHRRPEGLELAPLSLRDLLGVPGFVEGSGEVALDESEWRRLVAMVGMACQGLAAARTAEGAALRPHLEGEIAALESFVAWLQEQRATLAQALLDRLRGRLAALVGEGVVSEARLLEEAAVLAERADVAEEAARLAAHLAQLRQLLVAEEPVGKRLEFLLQEVLREVNTAASKCREVGMGERVVAAKAAVERLREQVANLE